MSDDGPADRPDWVEHTVRRGDESFSFWCRRNSAADAAVLQQVFVQQQYQLDRLAQGRLVHTLYERALTGGLTPLIVDAGANIGASVAYFAAIFPQASIVAIEPAPTNVELLKRNVSRRENVVVVECAIGAEDGTMYLVDPGRGEWAFRVEDSGEHAVPVCSMSTVLERAGTAAAYPLICKIDIEGGEAHLFEKSTEWVDRFPSLPSSCTTGFCRFAARREASLERLRCSTSKWRSAARISSASIVASSNGKRMKPGRLLRECRRSASLVEEASRLLSRTSRRFNPRCKRL